jgi:hypothetical protein
MDDGQALVHDREGLESFHIPWQAATQRAVIRSIRIAIPDHAASDIGDMM